MTTTPATASRATYEIDPAHSEVSFTVRHMLVTNARGRFAGVKGTITVDEGDPAASGAEVEIDAASVDTRDEKRDAHLRSPDFFDVERFPKITFRSKRAGRAGEGWTLEGDLTIRDVTRPVTLKVEELTAEVKDPWGGVRRGARATTKVDRKDFGLGWNVLLEAGGFVVADEVKIELDVQLVKKTA